MLHNIIQKENFQEYQNDRSKKNLESLIFIKTLRMDGSNMRGKVHR